MTLTIGARWRVTFAVQSLARVSMPAAVSSPSPRSWRAADLAAIAAGQQLRKELAEERAGWQREAWLAQTRRMF